LDLTLNFPLPALGFQVVGVNVSTPGYRIDNAANILAILDGCIAFSQVGQGYFVTDGNVIINIEGKIGIVFGYDTQHFGSGCQALYDHDAYVVLIVMDKQMGNTHFTFNSWTALPR
jgi:hypothetical protein